MVHSIRSCSKGHISKLDLITVTEEVSAKFVVEKVLSGKYVMLITLG